MILRKEFDRALKDISAATEDSKRKVEILYLMFKKSFTQEDRTGIPSLDQHTHTHKEDIELCITGVEKELKKLKRNRSPGRDGIPITFYREYSSALVAYLSCIYRECLAKRKAPSD